MRSGGPEADEKQLKKLFTPTTKLKLLQRRIEDLEEKLKERPSRSSRRNSRASWNASSPGTRTELH